MFEPLMLRPLARQVVKRRVDEGSTSSEVLRSRVWGSAPPISKRFPRFNIRPQLPKSASQFDLGPNRRSLKVGRLTD